MLGLESVERRIQRAARDRARRPALDLFADRHRIRVVFEPQNGEQDDLLELAEIVVTHGATAPVSTLPALQALYARVQRPVPAAGGLRRFRWDERSEEGRRK